ncbi:MAG TPA: archease [Rudaea sp.]|nr:archease [Rudaea sp.]
MDKSFAYFDHDADIGIIGRGATIEQAFEAAADAMFAIMAKPARRVASTTIRVIFIETDLELALVTWLNRLLAEARTGGLMLFSFRLERHGSRWDGSAKGCPWGRTRERGVEVKGATLTALSVRPRADGMEARCVVDV